MNPEGVIEELRLERSLWSTLKKEIRFARSHEFATKMAKIDRSDPFTYDRVFNSMMNNYTTPDDYRKIVAKR